MKIIRTNSNNSDFIKLVAELDADLAIRDGEEHAFYDQFNKIDHINHVIVAYQNGVPVGCGAIKQIETHTVEVKRMYTTPNSRGKGVGTEILKALEQWAEELFYKQCILETGKKQPEAIALYLKNGFIPIPNYGQYKGVENSLCFEKKLKSHT